MNERQPQVYVASVEVKPLRGSAMWGKAQGGFAYCYSMAVDARDAIDKVVAALEEDRYELLAAEWIMPHADMSWDADDEGAQQGHADEAARSKDVVYSDFSTYEAEQEH